MHAAEHTWDDGAGDAEGPDILHEFEEAVHIVEELRHNDLATSINLRTTQLSYSGATAQKATLLRAHRIFSKPC